MFSTGKLFLTVEEILDKVSEEQILAHYFGIKKIPNVMNSPLRNDKNPSFSIYYRDSYKIGYFDFATKESGGVFDLLMNTWHMSLNDVLCKIYQDLSEFHLIPDLPIYKSKKLRLNSQYNLKCKIRPWKDHDFEFWNAYGLTKQWLEFGNIYPISDVIIINDENKKIVLAADKYAYVFIENKDENISIKIYQPYNKKFKWLNNHNSSVWDLWTTLPKEGDKLIITSSRKDALCILAHTGIPTTGLQAESVLPKAHVIDELKTRFTNIYVLYDNDFDKSTNYGQLYGNHLATTFNLYNLCIPTNLQSKDPSDLRKNHGGQQLINTIFNLINQYEIS